MGAKQIVLRKVDGADILRRIDEHGVTLLCGAPAVVAAILDAAATWDGEIPGRDRMRIVVAGAPPPTRTIERVETELGWEFIQIYGLTETSPLLTMNRDAAEWDDLSPAERAVKLGRAGAPAVGVRLEIDDEGEVLARSNVVLEGYWEQPEATADAIVDGWFHTGDGGTIDDEGYLTISRPQEGRDHLRAARTCRRSRSRTPCSRIRRWPRCASSACPDEKWGETVKALVVLAPGADGRPRQELIEHCRSKLAHFKCPSSVEFRDELARTATGKLQKFKLRAPYWEGRERQVN